MARELREHVCTRHSRLQLTDVLQQRLWCIFPLSLHASSEVHEQARSPLRELDAVLLIGFDVLAFACVTCERVMMMKLGDVYNLMLTAMIWRTERRTVVAAMVGGNCNMDETLEAIWAEVTIQSKVLLPVLRLMALRAMKSTKVQRLESKVSYDTVFFFMLFRVVPTHQMKISGLSKRVCLGRSP
jgi:hypothetical protein